LERLAYFHNDWFTTLLLQVQCHVNNLAAVDNNDVDAERQRVVATTFSMSEGGVKVIAVGKS
jgi:hypothetical protein